jgi:hypothetical protein
MLSDSINLFEMSIKWFPLIDWDKSKKYFGLEWNKFDHNKYKNFNLKKLSSYPMKDSNPTNNQEKFLARQTHLSILSKAHTT